jgi:tetratricopeptide (TPR) repeat protein
MADHMFATERAMRDIHELIGSEDFESRDDLNERLAELTRGGRIAETVKAKKQADPKWVAQQLAYDALEGDDPREVIRLLRRALTLDPDCTDAEWLLLSLTPMESGERIRLLRAVVKKAERNFGESFFEESKGRFWGIMSTRPYLRAMQKLGELLHKADRFEESLEVFERMIELNEGDNLGIRYIMLSLLLAMKRPQAAADLISKYPGELTHSAIYAWGRVIERWLCGEFEEAEAAVLKAREVNPYTERYLTGSRRVPEITPAYYRPGDDTEAQVAAKELSLALRKNPEFREWLRGNRSGLRSV